MNSRTRQMVSLLARLFLIALVCWCLGRYTRHYHLEVVEQTSPAIFIKQEEAKQEKKEPFETTETTTTTTSSSTTTTTTTTKTLESNFELDYILLNINVTGMDQEKSDLLRTFDDRKARLRRVCLFRSSIQREFNKTTANSTTNIIYAIDKLQRLLNGEDEPDEPKCRFRFPLDEKTTNIYHDDAHQFTACFPPETGSAFWLRNYQRTLTRFDIGTVMDKYELKSATNDFVTFITVRHPFDRLLMMYRNVFDH